MDEDFVETTDDVIHALSLYIRSEGDWIDINRVIGILDRYVETKVQEGIQQWLATLPVAAKENSSGGPYPL